MVNVILGIFSPHRFELPEYAGYNVRILKDNFRLLEVIINRGGSPGGTVGLYFNGRTNFFQELPLPNSSEIEKVYNSLSPKVRRIANKSISLIAHTNKITNKLHRKNKLNIFATLFNKRK